MKCCRFWVDHILCHQFSSYQPYHTLPTSLVLPHRLANSDSSDRTGQIEVICVCDTHKSASTELLPQLQSSKARSRCPSWLPVLNVPKCMSEDIHANELVIFKNILIIAEFSSHETVSVFQNYAIYFGYKNQCSSIPFLLVITLQLVKICWHAFFLTLVDLRHLTWFHAVLIYLCDILFFQICCSLSTPHIYNVIFCNGRKARISPLSTT